MKVFYSASQSQHNPLSEIYDGALVSYAEKAERTESILSSLRADRQFTILESDIFSDDNVLAVHTKEYQNYIKSQSEKLKEDDVLYPSNYIMDTYTPITRSTYESARASVNTALSGAKALLDGDNIVYSLCRPPGHHADCNHSGGYCFFNNTAIAAHYLSNNSAKVAILDIDYHHGNGTQNIFYDRADVLYISLHADPSLAFPYSSGYEREKGRGKGYGFTHNFPLNLSTDDENYLITLQQALRLVKNYAPDYLIVSAGFDTHSEDPIAGLKLTSTFYSVMAETIAKLAIPILIIQEGGYNVNRLGELCHTFLSGLKA